VPQLALEFDSPTARRERAPRLTIAERFERYDRANPRVYEAFVRFAREAKRRGLKKYSADAVIQRLRWHFMIDLDGPRDGEFLINDNFSAYFARKAMAEHPDLQGFFCLRRLRSE
jgi:hypothetical protein